MVVVVVSRIIYVLQQQDIPIYWWQSDGPLFAEEQ